MCRSNVSCRSRYIEEMASIGFCLRVGLFDDDRNYSQHILSRAGRGGFAVEPSGFAENIGERAGPRALRDDTGFVEESVFWFQEALVGDDLAEQFEGAILVRLEK